MIKRLLLTVLFLALALSPCAGAGEPVDEALTAAETWLALVDAGRYGESWSEGAAYFRKAVNQNQWEKALEAVRTPLGKALSRQRLSADFTTSLPGAPDGRYVVIRFQTAFEHKNQSIETVTPMLDPDGIWRVSGYFIK